MVVIIRSRGVSRRGHIPGTHNIPYGLLIWSEPPQRDLILVGANGLDSARALEALHEQGLHRRVVHLEGGLTTWLARGSPLETEGPWNDRAWPENGLLRLIRDIPVALKSLLRPHRLAGPTTRPMA